MNWWSSSVFKGRLGEAIVESVLLEFGYIIKRIGQEHQNSEKGLSGQQKYAPDLLVIDPRTREQKYVEVKLRTSRPMAVLLKKSVLDRLRRYYPNTVLVFVSAYNGSVNCTDLNALKLSEVNLKRDGTYEINLLTNAWQPIWKYFPLIKKGKRLADIWLSMKRSMNSFAESNIQNKPTSEESEEERDGLLEFIEDNWDVRMLEQDMFNDNPEQLGTEDLWKRALKIHAFQFALAIHGEENIQTTEFQKAMDKALGLSGENYVRIDLKVLRDDLSSYPDILDKFERWIKISQDSGSGMGKQTLEALCGLLPPGIGKALIIPDKGSIEDGVEIDLRTAAVLTLHTNRLDIE